MPRGSLPGERRGGRQKGVPNKKTQEVIAEIAASGITPMDFMLKVMRDDGEETSRRLDAAKSVAPYVHPKLASLEITGKDGEDLVPAQITNQSLDLARTLAFLLTEGARAVGATQKQPIEVKPA